MDASIQSLLARLLAGPTMLLLGQYAGDEDEWAAVALPDPSDPSTPCWLADIAQYRWNGVFTSRIDASLRQLFDADWRRAVPTAKAQVGRNPRSTTELQLRYLFGGLGLPEDEQPPHDLIQEVETRARAIEVLNTLADTLITPRGVIIIEGYKIGDRLTPQELFAFTNRLQSGQAHLFSTSEPVRSDPFIAAAVQRGTLALHDESFASVLGDLQDSGLLQGGDPEDHAFQRKLIPVGDGFARVDVSTWNRVSGTVRPIDTDLLTPFTAASSALRYQRFHDFLGASEGAPSWKAVASDYNLRRDFESKLLRQVRQALEDLTAPEPIIVAGQTATGKSIALCALALDVARSGQAAVLHRSRRGDRPPFADVDAYAAWVDDNHMHPTLLVWDGMMEVEEYYSLQRRLRSRGRRVVIVGSTYRLPGGASKAIIPVSSELSKEELSRARKWLESFNVPMPNTLRLAEDSSFLAFLYRTLPATERGLRRGLSNEMRTAERGLEGLSRLKTGPDGSRNLTTMARALKDAGIDIEALTPSDRPDATVTDLDFDERSTAEQLTALVLVAGSNGLRLPLELPLRMLGREGSSHLVELVKDFDIFRWTEDDDGSQYLGARTQLEAMLLAMEDLNPRTEVAVVTQIIENLRPQPNNWGGEEVEFVVNLMAAIGPQSPNVSRYAGFYLDFAQAFGRLRTNIGWAHPRLVLLEANLGREFVIRAQSRGNVESEQRLEILREKQELLESTIEETDAGPRTRLFLLVELASTDGAQVYELSRQAGEIDSTAITELMEKVTRAALNARKIDRENIYPVDVIAWSTKQAVERAQLPEDVCLDLLANAQASLDSIDPDTLSPNKRANYDRQRTEFSRLLNDEVLEAEHLAALMENRDPAAYYFRAQRQAELGYDDAIRLLLEAPAAVRDDWRCARLLLDLCWRSKTGRGFLRGGDRQTLAFGRADWTECIRITNAIANSGDFDKYRRDFLKGLSLFHLESYKASENVFRDLDEESEGISSRVRMVYLASDESGNARQFTGRVEYATQDGRRGFAWVDQLSIRVPFIPLRFSVSDFRSKNEILPAFHIAFNMRGAIADPIRPASQNTRKRTTGGQ